MAGGAVIVRPATDAATPPDALDQAAAGFAAASKSAATRRAYAADWRDFLGWCAEHGEANLPASGRTVGRYLTHLAGLGRSVSTIDRRAAAIAAVHRAAGHTAPTALEEVRSILTGIRNTLGRRPDKKQEAFSGHSPRRGFATSAGDDGADLRLTAKHMRHAKLETTLGYMEDGELFRENAGWSFM